MAALLNRPLVVHEQNSIAGLANACWPAWPTTSLRGFPDVLQEVAVDRQSGARVDRAAAAARASASRGRSGPLQLLVVGGSLGAQALNEVVPQALALMPEPSAAAGHAPGGREASRRAAAQLSRRPACRRRRCRLHRRHGGALCARPIS